MSFFGIILDIEVDYMYWSIEFSSSRQQVYSLVLLDQERRRGITIAD